MSLEPFLNAPVYIQVHAAAATLSLVLGPVVLYRKRRDRMHKVMGYIWVLAMLCVAISAFFIHSFAVIGPFSPIHGLAIFTIWSVWRGISLARHGNIRGHKTVMRNLYWFGLVIAGLANFLPGRMSNEAAFGGNDALGFIVIGVGAAILVAVVMRGRKGARPSRSAQMIPAE